MGNSSSNLSKKELEKDLIDNSISKNTDTNENTGKYKDTSFSQIIDYIATKYVLTSDFKSLTKLYDKEYCNELVVLTSDIIEKYFTDLEVNYLNQRIKNGVEENEMTKDNMIFFNKSDIDKLNVNNQLKKKRICNGIAKFYVKIAHIFAAIVLTLNPVYTYKDEEGNTIKTKLYEKNKIPKNVERKLLKLGICDERINSLKNGMVINENYDITINPKFCGININSNGDTKVLGDEPGIPELIELYEDKYNYETGQFIGMTEDTEKIYKKDLELFYKIFTGSEEMPADIKKFSDIKLREYHKTPGCDNKMFSKKVSGSIKLLPNNVENKEKNEENQLFILYAENIKNMMANINKSQQDLLTIINELFTYVVEKSGERKIIVNPKLTETKLQEVLIKARELIINLYLNCENDYVKGIKLYQAIVEKKIKDTTVKQIEVLEKATQDLLEDKIEKSEDEIKKEIKEEELKTE